LDRRLGGPQSRSGRLGKEKILDPTGTSYPKGIGGSFPGVKRPGREADHSPPASTEVKKMWIYTSTPPFAFMEGQLYLELHKRMLFVMAQITLARRLAHTNVSWMI
jgi:hypothetical protein